MFVFWLQSLLRWVDVIDTIRLIAAGRYTSVQHKRSNTIALSPRITIPEATMISSRRELTRKFLNELATQKLHFKLQIEMRVEVPSVRPVPKNHELGDDQHGEALNVDKFPVSTV